MNQNTQNQLNKIQLNKFVNYLVLIAALLNLYALNLRERNLLNNITSNTPQKIYMSVLLIGVISNIILFNRNLKELKQNNNSQIYKIRQLGNALVLIALVCVIYFETQTSDNTDSPFI